MGTLRLNVSSAWPKVGGSSVVHGPPGVPWLQPVTAASVSTNKPTDNVFMSLSSFGNAEPQRLATREVDTVRWNVQICQMCRTELGIALGSLRLARDSCASRAPCRRILSFDSP
jgi:hypothetical protein